MPAPLPSACCPARTVPAATDAQPARPPAALRAAAAAAARAARTARAAAATLPPIRLLLHLPRRLETTQRCAA